MELALNNSEILAALAWSIAIHVNWERGVKLATKAQQLNAASAAGGYLSTLAYDFHRRGRFRQAVQLMTQHANAGIVENLRKYTAAYPEPGELERAREYRDKRRRIDPEWSTEKRNRLGKLWSFEQGLRARYMRCIAEAGYPVSK